MSSFPPSTIPAAEVELARTAGRVAARYAVYPPLSAFRAEQAVHPYEALHARGDTAPAGRPLAICVHLPFCYSACAFCNCTKIVTRDGGKAVRYLDFLERDIAIQAGMVGERRTIARMGWAGGTPTYYTASQLQRIWRALRRHFVFAGDGEYAIDIDPRTVSEAAIAELRHMGFTIAALCVPDLDPAVLDAVTRPQRAEQSLAAIAAARRAGFSTVAVELMYGLPCQTAAGFAATLGAIVAAGPDRIALHDYVHAPRRHKAQRQLSFHDLPRASDRLEMLGLAVECLAAAGYSHIGPDVFVRAGEPLAQARQAQHLHYDMLGYSAAAETDIVAIGAAAVGATGLSYTQNDGDLGAYYDRLGAGMAPVARRISLTPDDLVRRTVMRLLQCHARVPYAVLEAHYSVSFERYFAAELQALERFAAAGLLRMEDRAIVLEPRGRLWVRNVCAVFDRYGEPRREAR